MAKLTNIEIFAPGTWNGESYTESDLIEMVNNSNRCRVAFRALLSLNHDEVAPAVIREAAFGTAVRYYARRLKDGILRVFADFENVPDALASLIHRHYPNRSIDLYPRFKLQDGTILKNVIAGVSFLGAKMPPAVKGMFPDFALAYRHDPALLCLQSGLRTFNHPYKEITTMKKPVPFQEIGAMLSKKRAELGVTEADIAESVGGQVTAQTVLDIESGLVMPSEALIEPLAAAYQIDPAMLMSPSENQEDTSDAMLAEYQSKIDGLEAQIIELRKNSDESGAPETPDVPDQVKQHMADMEQRLAKLAKERDDERKAREALTREHFFERLEAVHHASKVLTGQRVREFAEQLSSETVLHFSEGDQTQSPQEAFLSFLESLAQAKTVTVPVERVTEPDTQKKTYSDKPSEARELIQQYQDTHKSEYMEARLAVKRQRPELFVDDHQDGQS